MTQSFFPVDRVDVTPGVLDSWEDVACSSYIPVGATGVILYIQTVGSAYTQDFGLRKKGSGDGYNNIWEGNHHEWALIGVDGDRIFQCYVGDADIKVYLVGYTGSGVTFFTNRTDVSPAVGSWVEVDLSGNGVPANAIGAIFEIYGGGIGPYEIGLRPPTSSEDTRKYGCKRTFLGITGCSSQKVDLYRQNDAAKFYLIGYITDGATFLDTSVDKSLAATGSWEEIDCSGDAPNAVWLFFDIDTSGAVLSGGLRKYGSANEDYKNSRWRQAAIECDANQKVQGKIESTAVDFYLVGYATKVIAGWSGKVAGVTDPAKVMGVAKANIAKVKGVV